MNLERIEELIREAWPVIFKRDPMMAVGAEIERPATEWEGPAAVKALCVDGIFVYPTEMDSPTAVEHNTCQAWGLGVVNLIPLPPGDKFEEVTRVLRETPEGDVALVRELAARVARKVW